MTDFLLGVIVFLVLVLPLSVHKVEENLEMFLFVCGVAAVTIAGVWHGHLVYEAAKDPLAITAAVLALGFIFKTYNLQIKKVVVMAASKIGFKATLVAAVIGLGLFSSVITAIIAAVALAEISNILGLKGESKVRFVVLACFAIGMGAALTPVGEPLSTIAVSKLKAPPHNADFFFLLKMLGPWLVPGVILMGALTPVFVKQNAPEESEISGLETNKNLIFRAVKVYFFVAALVFLGAGLKPLAEKTIFKLPDTILYWANSVSAILDNATLAAIEIVPTMSEHTILFLLTGLILAGGLLIPGNIPNIICASKLKIKSSQWAKFAIPLGGVMMVVYFILLEAIAK